MVELKLPWSLCGPRGHGVSVIDARLEIVRWPSLGASQTEGQRRKCRSVTEAPPSTRPPLLGRMRVRASDDGGAIHVGPRQERAM